MPSYDYFLDPGPIAMSHLGEVNEPYRAADYMTEG